VRRHAAPAHRIDGGGALVRCIDDVFANTAVLKLPSVSDVAALIPPRRQVIASVTGDWVMMTCMFPPSGPADTRASVEVHGSSCTISSLARTQSKVRAAAPTGRRQTEQSKAPAEADFS